MFFRLSNTNIGLILFVRITFSRAEADPQASPVAEPPLEVEEATVSGQEGNNAAFHRCQYAWERWCAFTIGLPLSNTFVTSRAADTAIR